MILDSNARVGLGAPNLPPLSPPHLLIVREPSPVQVGDMDAAGLKRHMGDALQWATPKFIGPRGNNRLRFMATTEDIVTARAIFSEKRIAPSLWLAWRAHMWKGSAPSLGALLCVSWLAEGRKRAWFRQMTENKFGGRLILTDAQCALQDAWSLALHRWRRKGVWSISERRVAELESQHNVEAKELAARLQLAAMRGQLFPRVKGSSWDTIFSAS